MNKTPKELYADVLILGTGGAGLRAAIEAKRYGADVLVVDKSLIGVNNNTAFSGAGFRSALPGIRDEGFLGEFKTPEDHIIETIKYGSYLNDQKLVEILALDAPARLLEMQAFGIEPLEKLRLHRNTTKYGSKLTKPMIKTCKKMGVRFRPHTIIYDLIRANGSIGGAIAFDCLTGARLSIKAKAMILAAGGAGEIYLRNNTVSQTTGDAYSMAFRVGAELIGMELIQIDPYILAEPGLPLWFIHPSKARFKAILRNVKGEPFLPTYLPLKGRLEDPFPIRYGVHPGDVRELISRAMYMEVLEGRGENDAVLLDCTQVPEADWHHNLADLHSRRAIMRGLDLNKNMVHMMPGAIFNLGGIRINERCETTVPGLYAAGECTGLLHGAGRLGGNALSECIVFGAIAGRQAADYAGSRMGIVETDNVFEEKEYLIKHIVKEKVNPLDPRDLKKSIKTIMWRSAGPVRWESGLKKGLNNLERLQEADLSRLYASSKRPLHLKEAVEAYHMATVGEIILKSALTRKESRGGGHYRLDFKNEDNKNWRKNVVIKNKNDQMEIHTVPVQITRFHPTQQ